MKKLNAVASVSIRNADRMTPAGRKLIEAWLRGVARDLVKDGKNYVTRYKATYYAA